MTSALRHYNIEIVLEKTRVDQGKTTEKIKEKLKQSKSSTLAQWLAVLCSQDVQVFGLILEADDDKGED